MGFFIFESGVGLSTSSSVVDQATFPIGGDIETW